MVSRNPLPQAEHARRAPSCDALLPWARVTLSGAIALAPVVALQAAPARPLAKFVEPGIYLSDSIEMSLLPDGSFEVLELGGSRHAAGRYRSEAGRLVFVSGAGDIGKTRFPLTCELAGTFGGFAVRPAQMQCKPFDGLAFRSAN